MMHDKKINRILLMVYTLLILFFMFVCFGRSPESGTYHYSFDITSIPLWIPDDFSIYAIRSWIFALGNLIAFIPFGVLLPINSNNRNNLFIKSFLIFLMSITVLESLQMLSFLGSFDMEDILVNTLGFLIGYISWKISRKGSKKALKFTVSSLLLVLMTIGISEYINPLITGI